VCGGFTELAPIKSSLSVIGSSLVREELGLGLARWLVDAIREQLKDELGVVSMCNIG
jgi:hypothetical protein